MVYAAMGENPKAMMRKSLVFIEGKNPVYLTRHPHYRFLGGVTQEDMQDFDKVARAISGLNIHIQENIFNLYHDPNETERQRQCKENV